MQIVETICMKYIRFSKCQIFRQNYSDHYHTQYFHSVIEATFAFVFKQSGDMV